MPHSLQPDKAHAPQAGVAPPELPFLTLWYRFMFFGWLFRDVNAATSLIERHAVHQHNLRMRRHLPTYLRRWSFFTLLGFALGCLFERATQASLLSAWFFTWSCVTLTGMVVISVVWALLARARAR
jgi:hypothetical protein